MPIPESMRPLDGEDERHHRAFLLYAMQSDDEARDLTQRRSLRAVARVLPASDNSVRKWREKFNWHERIQDPNHCQQACDLYAEMYHPKLGGRDVAIIQERLGGTYQEPGHKDKTERARAVDLFEQVERESIAAQYRKESDERYERLKTVLDATVVRIAQELQREDSKVRVGDLGVVLRGFKELEESRIRLLSMLPSEDDVPGGEQAEPMSVSQRVLQVRAKGGNELEAIRDDLAELSQIVDTMLTHEEHSNVVPMQQAAG